MKNFKNVGSWWSDRSIDLIETNSGVYALYGWNGEKYLDCWKCVDGDNMIASEERYVIAPVYSEELNEDDVYEIIGYKVE